MDMNDNFVAEQVTENVEQTTEQSPKMFTQDEVNDIVGKSKARERAKITKQFERKYGQLEEVLKAGTGKASVEEVTDTLTKFYQGKGVSIPEKPMFTDSDIEVLANAEAEEVIRSGYEDVVDETDRLAEIGIENMTARERAVFTRLATYRQDAERSKELSQIGVTEDVYNSQEFKNFAGKFNPTIPITDVFDIFRKTQPQKDIRTMGSMTNTNSGDNGVKDFYTPEEARRFTKQDFDKNPALFEAVNNSMLRWKR